MRLPGKLRRWMDWILMDRILAIYQKRPGWAPFLQDYFIQWYEDDPEPFGHGMFQFVAGYSTAWQFMGPYVQKKNPDVVPEKITEPEYLDALEWMDSGLRELSPHIRQTSKKECQVYGRLLGELSAFLDCAGAFEDALRCFEYRMEFGKQYTPEDLCGEDLDKLYLIQAQYLVHAGRYAEAIQLYPRKSTLHAIMMACGKETTPGAMIDMFQYVQAVIDSAQDPNGRCGSEDLEYAHRWMSDFYLSAGSYPDVMAINMEDIIGNKIGEKKSRNAVMAYLHFAIGAYHGGLMDYAKSSLSTACRMAVEVLDRSVDSEANLFYQIFSYYFQIYLQESNPKEAGYVLEQAMEFLNERVERQRAEKGEQAAIALVDVDAREQLLLCEAELLSLQGEPMKALERSDWVADSHRERRQRRTEGCEGVFDPFYLEALSANVLFQLQASRGRTSRSDERIQEMLREIVHIAEDLKLITLDNARQDAICDMQTWAHFIFSYWVEFPEHGIRAEDLYKFELNTKNIDPIIRFLQNKALQDHRSPQNDAVHRAQKELWGDYQKAAFESSTFRTNQKQFLDQQTALDVKRYQLLKNSEYEFTCCEPRLLQQRLSGRRAVLEFRKFVNHHLFPDAVQPIRSDLRYGAFLITRDHVDFKALGGAEEIEQAVSALLMDIQDMGTLDSGAVSAAKLNRVEEELLGPFREALVQIEELYIVPDDALYRVPFELMPMWSAEDSRETASTGIKLCYLTSARSILKDSAIKGNYQSIRVIADPQFSIGDDRAETVVRGVDIETKFLEPVRTALQTSGISALKYTGLEAEYIEKVFAANHGAAELVRGQEARKDNVFTTQTDILHFATHGFTLLAQVEEETQKTMYSPRARQIAASDNALLRCGLLLSGVDNWLRGVEVDGFGNGILTGMDILSEDLAKYQLVVLSACSTGQGAVPYSGEGVEGLRSAFELAGVPVLICTLWEVDDFATALFMTEFYQELQRGSTPLLALYAAKWALRNMSYTELERRGFWAQADSLFEEHMALSRDERPFVHPRYWAGFILHGVAFVE